MAEQIDAWTTWYEWLEPPATQRDIRHHGDFASHAFDRDLFSKLQANAMADITNARSYSSDPAELAMVLAVCNALVWTLGVNTILLYAIFDCRELIAGASMSKEEIFDLWLERAGEMAL